MIEEIWRDIPGFEGYYAASTYGRIKSLERTDSIGRHRQETIRKPSKDKLGYNRYNLSVEGKIYYERECILVASTFPEICGERFPGAEVSHLDENPQNDRAENLRFVTHSENINWGTRNEKAGLKNSKPVLQYTLSGEFVKEWQSATYAAKCNNWVRSVIQAVCTGKGKTAYKYVWKYKNPGA